MASSNIKLFDENKGNMLTDTEFNISNQRLNGLQTGVASSQLQNKAMYQVSLVAYAIAQVMMQNGMNANDTDAVSAFVANLSGAILQKVYDIATTAEAQAGVATGKWMSPALVKAAFDYRKANTAEAQAGTDDTKWMSPALVKAFFSYMEATTSEAQAGADNTKWMSPALVRAAFNYMKANASEAQAGTNDTKWMSPSLVRTAIDYVFSILKATTAEAQAGDSDAKWMSPAKVISLLTAQGCTRNDIIHYAALAMSGDSGYKASVKPTVSGIIGTNFQTQVSSGTCVIEFDLSSLPSNAKICYMCASNSSRGSSGSGGSAEYSYTATLTFRGITIDTRTGKFKYENDTTNVINSMLIARNIVATIGNYMTNSEKIILTISYNKSSGSGAWYTTISFRDGTIMNYLQ